MAAFNDPVFGLMIGAHHVDAAIVTMLQKWDRTYLQEVARVSGEDADELRPFRNWRVSSELEHMPEDQLPTCIIANMGLVEEPYKYGGASPGQNYNAKWRYRVGAHVSARGKKVTAAPRAQTLAKMYVLGVRAIMIQKRDEYDDPTRESLLGMIDWVDEDYDGLDSDADRTICMAYGEFYVEVCGVATWANGPKSPVIDVDPADPDSPTWPRVQTTHLDIVKVPTDESIEDFIESQSPVKHTFDPSFSEEFDV